MRAKPAPARVAWTEQRIRQQGPQMKAMDALMAVWGIGEAKAKRVLRDGDELPFPVLRLGRKRVVATAHVLRVLGLAGDEATDSSQDANTQQQSAA